MLLRAGTAIAVAFSVSSLAMSSLAAHAEPVTPDRLKAAGADTANWLTHGRDYSNQRFSPLDQINTGTIKKLVPKWIYQTGVSATFQTTPLVADGIMYLSAPFSHVIALDAKSGARSGATNTRKRRRNFAAGRRTVAWPSAMGSSTSQRSMRASWRLTPKRARPCGISR